MKSFLKVVSGMVALVLLIVFFVFMFYRGTYNSLVSAEEGVNASWGQVQNVYKRRADLIPNLVAVVKGYASHEHDTFMDVTEARAKVGQINLKVEQLGGIQDNAEIQKQFIQAQDSLSTSLSRLMVIVEKYPELKANENFLSLQSQLEGTENRIATERMRNQEVVRDYNKLVRGFFTSMVASRTGFKIKPYFEAGEIAQEAPKVDL